MGLAATLADVARACGVSLATASKALSPHRDRCDLRPDTRDRIRVEAARLGWSRDRRRSARARRRWRNIGLLWGRRAPFSRGSYEGVPEAVGEALGDGHRLIITPTPRASDWHEVQMSLKLDGVITLGSIDEAILGELEEREYPAVVVNARTGRRLPQILADDLGGTEALAAHLAGLGHRRLVFLNNPWDPVHYSESDRKSALAAAAAAGAFAMATVASPRYDLVVQRCRAGATAVVCQNWWDVAEVLAALRQAGLAVPGRVSVAACHDLSWFSHLSPPITAVAVPLREMAVRATCRLLGIVAGTDGETRLVETLPERLQARASTGPAPRENRLAKAGRGREAGR